MTTFAPVDTAQFFDRDPDQRRMSKAEVRRMKRAIKTQKQTSRHGSPLVPKTEAQKEFLDAIKENDVLLACGGAGVGKTYVTARYALQELLAGNYERIILTRPMVAVSGEDIGFLPGGIDSKVAPWATPVIDAFKDGASKDEVTRLMKEGRIEFVPFAFIRGRTFNDCFIIADESQNLTIEQFKVLITRVGENAKIVISGDLRQSDLRGPNGLDFAIKIADNYAIDCEIFEFEDADVVRSKVASQWVNAFSKYDEEKT